MNPHTAWEVPADAIGWCAVVLPAEDAYQGYFIRRSEEAAVVGVQLAQLALAVQSDGVDSMGAMQAALVEGAVTGRQDLIAGASLVLADTVAPYFIILAYREPGGTRTELKPMRAREPETARAEFEAMPEVAAIKQRIADKAPKQKH